MPVSKGRRHRHLLAQANGKVDVTFTLVGHRGAMGLEPENTLRSFRRAVELGADAIELDLRVTSDGHLVILHDRDVSRTTDGSGEISTLTLAQVKQFDAGEGETIPTFAEALDAISVSIQAEIKAPDATAKALELIRERELLDKVMVTSFKSEVLSEAQRSLPEAQRGLIFDGVPSDALDQARSVGAEVLCVGISALTAELVEECHAQKLSIYAWPVNEPEQLLNVLRVGADGVTSDFPGLLRDTIRTDAEARELLAARS